jgi:hypothetical protein
VHLEQATSSADKRRAAAIYQAVTESFGPGLLANLVTTKGYLQGSFTNIFWYSDKIQVHFFGSYDPSAVIKRDTKFSAPEVDERGGDFLVEFQSKELLKEYYEKFRAAAKKGI